MYSSVKLLAAGAMLVVALSACHADVTERVTINWDGSATVTLREVLDAELYRLSRESTTGIDAFGMASLSSQGWKTSREVDAADNHVLVASRTCGRLDLDVCLWRLPFVGRARWANSVAGGSAWTAAGGLLNDRVAVDLTLGPYGLPSSIGSDLRLLRRALSATAPSIVEVHFELAVPGTVLSTNGERMSDGALRWDLDIAEPTRIAVEYSVIDAQRAEIAGLLVISGFIGISILAARWKRF
jgi:hypothetical protein